MRTLITLAALAMTAAAAGLVTLYAGFYDISATDQHLAPTYWALDTGMRRSVKRRAAGVAVPPPGDARTVSRGEAHFREHCVHCHGAPGVSPAPFALGMTPVPANLAYTAREWSSAELFWVIKYGIKMTGMPAWEFRLADEEIWAIVAFLQELPRIPPRRYLAMPAPEHRPASALPGETPPDAERGRTAINQYACVTCHRIPGIVGPNAPVGPALEGIARRSMLAGVLPNSPVNMARWIREPQKVNPGSGMPDLGVTERDARDIAAYLATLR